MPYVKRDNQNNIIGVFNLPQDDAQELFADNDSALQAFVNRPAPQAINKTLEDAFLAVLPAHLGQPYLTPQVMLSIANLKQSVADFNRLGLHALSKQMLQGFDLPEEMAADKQTLIALFP